MITDRIAVPDVLARPRDHAIICTFGADLPFYEGPLWRYITRARNRVVLADDQMLGRELSDLATSGSRLRHININYLAAPIANPASAHAKLILLADATAGTLLVGSGNVGIDGYASRGEVFCRYDVSSDNTDQLAAFQTAKDLLDTMTTRGYLDTQVSAHLDHMWSECPWIWAAAPDGASPVRHNLITPLAEQLVASTAGEPVLNLLVHAPFYDTRCEALRRLLDALHPAQVTVLVQERRTSVDPAALARVLEGQNTPAKVLLAAAQEFPATYLHAKFILIRTATRSVTLTGSANLSLAALYRTDRPANGSPPGNIELVNLLDSPAGSFDELCAGLDLTEPATPIPAINIRYLGDEGPSSEDGQPRLLRGAWDGSVLLLEASSLLPPGALTLAVAGTDVPAELSVDGRSVTARPAPEAAHVLDRAAVPVWLRIDTPDGPVETTPIYPYHSVSLAGMLTGRRDPDLLSKAGDLDFDVGDEDLAALVDELDAALVIDPQAVWRLAGRAAPADSADDGPHLRWEDLDFEKLRRHPKLAQYQSSLGQGADRPAATDLQVILTAIAERFHSVRQGGRQGDQSAEPSNDALLDIDLDDLLETLPGDRDDRPGDDTPEEAEAKAEAEDSGERQRRRLKIETRNRLAWQRFCDRFIRGIADPEFIDLVGPGVVVANAIIFNHLLALLIARHVIDADKGIACQLQLWSFLWGDHDRGGYLDALDDDTQFAAIEAIEARGGEVIVLSAVDLAGQLTWSSDWDDLRTNLRDVWRRLLESPLLAFTADVMKRAASPGVRSATDIAQRLDELAREYSTEELHAALAAVVGTAGARISVMRVMIQGRQRDILRVDDPAATLDQAAASAALATWATMDPSRDYLRIEHAVTRTTALWDRANHVCWWYDRNSGGEPVTLQEPVTLEPAWAVESRRILQEARTADRMAA